MTFLDWVCSVTPRRVGRAILARCRRAEFEHLESLRRAPGRGGYGLAPFEEKGAIFVHVPKAAGVSVCRALFGGLGGGHTTLAQYRLLFEPEAYEEAFKFAFVRNPWDRLHSAYHFLAAGGMDENDAAWARANLAPYDGFEAFVRGWLNEENARTKVHFTPQHEFVVLPGRRRPGVDFVGRFETLAEDFETVRERIGGDPLPHDNRTPEKGGFRAAYTDETRAVVARVYRRDIELFGYTFG